MHTSHKPKSRTKKQALWIALSSPPSGDLGGFGLFDKEHKIRITGNFAFDDWFVKRLIPSDSIF